MRIEQLRLIAYGPFTDGVLDFSQSRGAFHLVYGPNEAGKSSALRALRGLLFGIPVRTRDSFRHPNPKLRLGARLTRRDGQRIAFIRRKGQSKTLRGEDGRSLLEESSLRPFLEGVDRDLFEQMFAIGHDDLVRGGEEIIAGGGSVGQALFAAGTGLFQLKGFQQRLEAECEDLFKTTGKKPRINNTLAALKDTRQKQKGVLLQARTWQTHHEALSQAQARLAALQPTLAAKQQRQGLLKRIREALPLMARRKEIDAALAAYAGLPELPENFGSKRRTTENTLQIAANDFKRAQTYIEELQKQASALVVPAKLLQNAALVEALQHDLGSFNKARQDRPGLEARMRLLYRQAASDPSGDGTAPLNADTKIPELPPILVGEIQELGQTHDRLRIRLETARERHRHLETEIRMLEEQRESITVPCEVEVLKSTLQSAQDAGPLGKQLSEARHLVAVQEENLLQILQRQALWSGRLEELAPLRLPSMESIDRIEDRLNALTQKLERQQLEKEKKEAELSRNEIELHTMTFSQDVPTEEDLMARRKLRDKGWGLVRRRLEGQGPAADEEQRFIETVADQPRLPDAFEASVRRADRTADRLRREAEQVSRKSLLEARKNQYAREQKTIAAAVQTTIEALSHLNDQWQQLWKPSGIQPSSPREMRAWLATILSVREKFDTLRSDSAKADRIEAEVDTLKIRLTQALVKAGQPADKSDSLVNLIATARSYVARQEKRRTQIESITKEHLKQRQARQARQAEITELEEELRAWRTLWGQKVARIGLAADASPSAANAVIESLRAAKTQRDEADVLRKRIQGIDHDAEAFKSRLEDLVDRLVPELRNEPLDRAALRLNARLNAARESQTARRSLQQQLNKAQADQANAKKRLDDATTRMHALCREANCEKPETIPEVENRVNKRRQLISELDALDNRLRHLSAGATVEAFVTEAAVIETDRIPADLEQLSQAIEALEREHAVLNQTIGTERAELRHMDGRATAARHAEEAESLLASLEADVERYARLKLASVILARTIEQYRDKHQGPLIRRASALFTRMSSGAFRGVRAEYDEKGNPVLVGIRSDNGEQVAVGGLSDGTADQLYLALRLASIEQYLDNSAPLPFVADDILLRFDDKRSSATLGVLAELADRTQVIFFTHHQHMVDLAREAVDDSVLQVHRL